MNFFTDEQHLLDCVYAKNLDGIEQCMEAGAFISMVFLGSHRRETPLHVAARQGCVESVDVMTREKYCQDCQDLDTADSRGYSALAVAVDEGHIEVVSLLLERGANPHGATGWKSSFPVEAAKNRGQTDMEALLLAAISKRALERDLAKPMSRAKRRDPMNRPADDMSAFRPTPVPACSTRRRL